VLLVGMLYSIQVSSPVWRTHKNQEQGLFSPLSSSGQWVLLCSSSQLNVETGQVFPLAGS
jgi:hypothetical protein